MTDSTAATKAAARTEARTRRKALSPDVRRVASAMICAHIIASASFVAADLVLSYAPVGSEADVLDVVRSSLDAGVRAAIPRVNGDLLSFDQIDEIEVGSLASLEVGAFGIPVAAQPRPVVPTKRTLALVPLLAFDRHGRRLGSGKGFYDRFLAQFPGVAIGVAFAVQEVELVPTEPHDRRLDGVVTEAGLLADDRRWGEA